MITAHVINSSSGGIYSPPLISHPSTILRRRCLTSVMFPNVCYPPISTVIRVHQYAIYIFSCHSSLLFRCDVKIGMEQQRQLEDAHMSKTPSKEKRNGALAEIVNKCQVKWTRILSYVIFA